MALLIPDRIDVFFHADPAVARTLVDIKAALVSLNVQGEKIMSKLTDYLTAQEAFNGRLSTAVDGLKGDIKTLNDKITELQNSPDRVTEEDQARIDALQAHGETVAAAVEALDAMTPPPVAVPPPADEPPAEEEPPVG